jgi:hypothetical protein
MIPLPKWIKEIFDKGSCPHCKKNLQKKGVFGVGIREEKVTRVLPVLNEQCSLGSQLLLKISLAI